MDQDERWAQFAAAAREMSTASGVGSTLHSAVDSAVEIVPHAQYAGISLVVRQESIDTEAATSDLVRRGDALQYELGEGPCWQSMYEQETVQSDDLRHETRWPTWSRRVSDELGVRSMLCFTLFVDGKSLGALNLYSTALSAFDENDRVIGLGLAAHVAIALAAAQNYEHLEGALATRNVIGRAEGMLMQRYGLDGPQAFSVLVRMSQHGDQKLKDIASGLVRDGIDKAP